MTVKEGDIVKVRYRLYKQDDQDEFKIYINGPLGVVINVSDNMFYYLMLRDGPKQEDFTDAFRSQLIYRDERNNFDKAYKFADLRYIYRSTTEDNEPIGHLRKHAYLHLVKGFDYCQKTFEQDDFYPKIKSKNK